MKKKYLLGLFLVVIGLIAVFSFMNSRDSKTEELSSDLQKSLNEYELEQGIKILQRTVVTEREPYVLVFYEDDDSSEFGMIEWRKDGFSQEAAPLEKEAAWVRLDGEYGTYVGSLFTKQQEAESVSILNSANRLIEKYDLTDDPIFLYSLPENSNEEAYFLKVENENGKMIKKFKVDLAKDRRTPTGAVSVFLRVYFIDPCTLSAGFRDDLDLNLS